MWQIDGILNYRFPTKNNTRNPKGISATLRVLKKWLFFKANFYQNLWDFYHYLYQAKDYQNSQAYKYLGKMQYKVYIFWSPGI